MLQQRIEIQFPGLPSLSLDGIATQLTYMPRKIYNVKTCRADFLDKLTVMQPVTCHEPFTNKSYTG